MRRFLSAIAVAGCLGLCAGPARAHNGVEEPSRLALSVSTVTPGGRLILRGSGAEPGALITFALSRLESSEPGTAQPASVASAIRLAVGTGPQAPILIGRVLAAAEGRFRATMRIPARTPPGLYAVPASSGEVVLGVSTVRVVKASIGGFPFTATVLPGLAGGAVLILAGGLLLLSLRQRQPIA
jgi:hypothetical protein